MLNHNQLHYSLMLIRYMNLGEKLIYNGYVYYIKSDGSLYRRSLSHMGTYTEQQLFLNLIELNEMAEFFKTSKINILHFKDSKNRLEGVTRYVFENEDREE